MAVFFLWRHDAEQSDGRDRPVTLGVEQDVDGLALLDVALVTAPRDELALLATLTVRSGPEDRVTEVRVGGVRARLDGGADAWRVTTALLDVRPDGAGLRAVAPYRAAAGTLVPVTVVLATRGETTFQVPVWSSDTWPDGA